jgi:hypothetical protein
VTTGRVYRLQLLLTLASVVLGSQSRWTHDHILLSQIRDSTYLEDQVPVLYPPGTGRSSYNHRHWVPFTSPFTTRRTTMEVFEPTSTQE